MLFTVLIGAAALTGCGGDDKDTTTAKRPTGPFKRTKPVPAGWQVSTTDTFSYGVPKGWKVEVRRPANGGAGELVSEAISPASSPELSADVVVAATPDYKSGFGGLQIVNDTDAKVRYSKRKVLKTERPTIPGAVGARLIVADNPITASDGTVATARQYDLVALSKSNVAIGMFIQVPIADADRSRVADVVKTLEIR